MPSTSALYGSISLQVTQASHGFSVGNVVRSSGANTYAKAQADSAANAEVVGIVTVVKDVNTFTLVTQGVITTGVPAQAAGTVLFLDPTTPGALTATEPSTVGQVSKPLVTVLENGAKAIFQNFRGFLIGAAATSDFSTSVISGNTAAVNKTLYVLTGNAAITLTLPASPTVNDTISVVNLTTVLTCVIARNGNNIMASATDLTLDKANAGFSLHYSGSTNGWVII